ncbi:MAG: DUF1735 domain-containing protein [Bacteroidetes bacterium]|jgi:hypothetical protein|uniref:DUF1735 domain-containing protein n=1 Tax=Candidatus Cryptobacteroides avicola TaxID=2840757 RepID=A0A940DRP9_9BACT|nr:DUF1735 domain-containing protein [Candidatus Cryptobacteroides avicola]
MKKDFLSAIIVIATFLPFLSSCEEKQEEQQIEGPASLVIQGAADGLDTYTVTDKLPNVTVDLRAEATEISGNVLSISFKVDLALVEAYNAANSTEYLAMPAEAFNMTSQTVILPRYNEVSSTAQISVDGNKIPENGQYLLPVTFDKVEGEEGTVFTDGGDVLYILVERNFPEGAKVRKYTLSTIPGFSASVHAFCWLPDGKIAVSGNNDTAFGGAVVSVDPVSGESAVLINNYSAGWCAYGLAVAGNTLYAGYKSGDKVGAYELSSSGPSDPQTPISGLNSTVCMAADEEGNLFAVCRGDAWSNHGRIYKYPAGSISGQSADENIFKEFDCRVLWMDFDENGDIIAWTANGFYKVAKDGASDPVYLFGKIGSTDQDGPASEAAFMDLYSFSVDSAGNMWCADFGAHKIKFIQKGEADDYSDAVVSTVVGEGASLNALGSGNANSPRGILANEDGTEVYFNDNDGKILYKIEVTFE